MKKSLIIYALLTGLASTTALAVDHRPKPPHHHEQLMQKLDLTSAQQSAIEQIKLLAHDEAEQHHQALKQLKITLHQLDASQTDYLAQVSALAEQKSQHIAALSKIKTLTHAKIQQELTEQQRQQAQQWFKQQHQLRADRHHSQHDF